MSCRHRVLGVFVLGLLGCQSPALLRPPPPADVRQVAVEIPANRTGGDLVVDDPGLFGRMFREKRTDVAVLLADELKDQLGRHGFTVVNDGRRDVPVLRSQIRRWEPYSADYSTVKVDIAASLVDPATGRQLWTLERADWHVPTRNADSRRDASETAIEVVAATLLDGWKPGSSTTGP